MLTVDQVARRAAREIEAGATLRPLDSLPTELRSSITEGLGGDALVLARDVDKRVRVICRFGVIDVAIDEPQATWILREVPPGVSAADIQRHVHTPLLCGPELAETRVE